MRYEAIRPVIDLYIGNIYNQHSYLEHRFLSFIQALESYHRRSNFSNTYMKKENYNKVLNNLIKCIPKEVIGDFRQSMKSRFKYLNEYSLKKRLDEIINKFNTLLGNFIPKDFSKEVKDIRNYLTHYDKQSIKTIPSREKLFILSEKLQIILEICLLHEIGFTDSQIKKTMSDKIRNINNAEI